MLFLPVVLLAVDGCYTRRNYEVRLSPMDTLLYRSSETTGDYLNSYGIVSSQEFIVEVKTTVVFAPEQMELTTLEGSRSHPLSIERIGKRVRALFQPVTSRYLFQQTGLRGDLDSTFVLSVRTGEQQEIFSFHAGKNYSVSVDQFGLKNVIPYVLDNFDMESGISQVKNVITPIIRNNECLISGFWMKVETFYKGENLLMKLRLVNQSMKEISIDCSQVRVNDVQQSPAAGQPSSPIVLRNGGRSEVKLQFTIPRAEHYFLDVRGLKYMEPVPDQVIPGILKLSAVNWSE